MPSASEFPVRGKVIEVTADGVRFSPSGSTYVLWLQTLEKYTGPVNKPVEGLVRVKGRKIYTVQSGGNFISPIVGPPKTIQGIVKYIDDQRIVVHGGVDVVVDLPTGDFAIDFNEGSVRVGSMANVVAFPGSIFVPLVPAATK